MKNGKETLDIVRSHSEHTRVECINPNCMIMWDAVQNWFMLVLCHLAINKEVYTPKMNHKYL